MAPPVLALEGWGARGVQRDRQDIAEERQPTPEELNHFIQGFVRYVTRATAHGHGPDGATHSHTHERAETERTGWWVGGGRRLYRRRAPRRILETRCLDEWTKVFEIKKHDDVPTLSLKNRLRVLCANGMRTSVR